MLSTWLRSAVVANSIPTDPNFSSVVALLHGDGSNGYTTVTDSSPLAANWSATGGCSISTDQTKFGSAAIKLGSTGSVTPSAANSNFVFGTGDFTIEFWIYVSARKAYGYVYSTGGGGSDIYISFDLGGNYLRLTDQSTVYAVGSTLNLSTWYHIAIVRQSGSSRVYVDGTGGTAVSCTVNFTANSPAIGATGQTGYIDDFRLTKGIARYSGSTITIPTAAYPDA